MTTAAAQRPAEAAPRHPRLLQAAILVGAVTGLADATLAAIALEPMGRHFGRPLAETQEVIALYLVVVVAALPLTGRAADRWGRRVVLFACFTLLGVGSVLSALAPAWGWLLAGRALQAVGGAGLVSGALALATRWAPRRRTGRAVALVVTAQAIAGLAAPPLGGLLVALGDWQAVFWAGAAAGTVGAVLALAGVPGEPARATPPARTTPALGLGVLLLGLGAGISAAGGTPVLGVGPIPWAAVAAAGAVATGATRPPGVRTTRRVAVATATLGLSTGALMTCLALLPYWLEATHGASAGAAGAAFLPAGVGLALTSPLGGRLADAGRTRTVTVAGMAVAACGLLLAALAAARDLWPLLGAGLLVAGAGNGLFSSPATAATLGLARHVGLGVASASLSTARNAGVVVGLAVTGAVWTGAHGNDHGDRLAAAVFVTAAAVCLLVAALSRALWADGGRTAARPAKPAAATLAAAALGSQSAGAGGRRGAA